MRHKASIGEYLAFLSIKYEVDPEKFLYTLRTAEEQKNQDVTNYQSNFEAK